MDSILSRVRPGTWRLERDSGLLFGIRAGRAAEVCVALAHPGRAIGHVFRGFSRVIHAVLGGGHAGNFNAFGAGLRVAYDQFERPVFSRRRST